MFSGPLHYRVLVEDRFGQVFYHDAQILYTVCNPDLTRVFVSREVIVKKLRVGYTVKYRVFQVSKNENDRLIVFKSDKSTFLKQKTAMKMKPTRFFNPDLVLRYSTQKQAFFSILKWSAFKMNILP